MFSSLMKCYSLTNMIFLVFTMELTSKYIYHSQRFSFNDDIEEMIIQIKLKPYPNSNSFNNHIYCACKFHPFSTK